MGIKAEEVYTIKETQQVLKVSTSTMMRLIKRGILRAAKVGGQYRILGREILNMIKPGVDAESSHNAQNEVVQKGA